jgi:7,8-dihydropterin-6-yl-methyl-4-(beta-D-ribofuranosyl)aminobenzene 5'-phosphate synthase
MNHDLKITVLTENTAGGRGLLAEHGLSFWIEFGTRRILFDTGQSRLMLANARRLGVDLASTDAIVLSHGHHDHTGGLAQVLRISPQARVHAHPAALRGKFKRDSNGVVRDIGMPAAAKRRLRSHAKIVLNERPTQPYPGFFLTGPPPRKAAFETVIGNFLADRHGTKPDLIPDDQSAYIETPKGTVVILGCAHAGVINTLRHVRTLTNQRPIRMVIGGMHLGEASPERMAQTVAAFRELDIPRLHPCHCTGFAAAARLWSEFPGRVQTCPVGTVIEP